MYMGLIYKAAFLLSYFSFLRISNLIPHSMASFNPLEQLAREDIIFGPPGAHIIIKWSKTLQAKNTVKILKIPSLGNSPLCPVTALRTALAITPSGSNNPLFQVKYRSEWVPLTDSKLRKNLSIILKTLHMHNSHITFHSVRRSGATLAFNSARHSEPGHLVVRLRLALHNSGSQCLCKGGRHLPIPTHGLDYIKLGFGACSENKKS